MQVFNALNLNMENKAHSYESPHLAAVFLLNNFHFMHKTFNRLALTALWGSWLPWCVLTYLSLSLTRNTHMLGLLEGVYEGIDNHYIGLISQQERAYQRGFTKLITFLGQEVTLQGAVSGEKVMLP